MKFEYEAIHKFNSALPPGVRVGLTLDQARRRRGQVRAVDPSRGTYETLQVIRFKSGERFRLPESLKDRNQNLFFKMTAPSKAEFAKLKIKEDKKEKARLEAEAKARAAAEEDAKAEAELEAEENAKAEAEEAKESA